MNITKISMSLNRPIDHGSTANFIQTDGGIFEKISIEVKISHINVTLNEGQDNSNRYDHSFKEIGLQMSECKPTLNFFLYKIIYSMVLSLEYSLD